MSKKTDYKKLWRKVKNENMLLNNKMFKLNQVIEGQVAILKSIKDGKIDVKEILK